MLIFSAAFLAALGCGLMAGLFFAFSTSVMKALAQLTPDCGMRSMQSINLAILNPLFLSIFLGTAADCLFLVIYSLVRPETPGAAWLVAGGALYLLGNCFVTMAFSVPRNNALARIDPSSPEAAPFWRGYVTVWTRWNHVRTVTALAAMASFIVALCQSPTIR